MKLRHRSYLNERKRQLYDVVFDEYSFMYGIMRKWFAKFKFISGGGMMGGKSKNHFNIYYHVVAKGREKPTHKEARQIAKDMKKHYMDILQGRATVKVSIAGSFRGRKIPGWRFEVDGLYKGTDEQLGYLGERAFDDVDMDANDVDTHGMDAMTRRRLRVKKLHQKVGKKKPRRPLNTKTPYGSADIPALEWRKQ